jgi:hypothetical protein
MASNKNKKQKAACHFAQPMTQITLNLANELGKY